MSLYPAENYASDREGEVDPELDVVDEEAACATCGFVECICEGWMTDEECGF